MSTIFKQGLISIRDELNKLINHNHNNTYTRITDKINENLIINGDLRHSYRSGFFSPTNNLISALISPVPNFTVNVCYASNTYFDIEQINGYNFLKIKNTLTGSAPSDSSLSINLEEDGIIATQIVNSSDEDIALTLSMYVDSNISFIIELTIGTTVLSFEQEATYEASIYNEEFRKIHFTLPKNEWMFLRSIAVKHYFTSGETLAGDEYIELRGIKLEYGPIATSLRSFIKTDVALLESVDQIVIGDGVKYKGIAESADYCVFEIPLTNKAGGSNFYGDTAITDLVVKHINGTTVSITSVDFNLNGVRNNVSIVCKLTSGFTVGDAYTLEMNASNSVTVGT